MDWLTPALGSAVISMAVLVAAYAYLYGRRRQSELGLWALGWTACLGLYLGLLAEMFLPLAMLWRYLSLALLGLSAFLLWAGTCHFVGSPPSRRAYAWGVLPAIWVGVAFLGLEERPWLAIPIFLFASAASLFTAASLYRYSRSGEDLGGARVAALGYGLWGVLELAYPFVHIVVLSPPPHALLLGLLLASGLILGLAISLIGLHMQKRERRACRQAKQLRSLRTIAAAVSQVLEPDEVLNLVARQAIALVGAETVAISLISEDGTRLIYKAAYGCWTDRLLGRGKSIRSMSICGWVTRTREGFYSENLAQDERTVEGIGEVPGLETAISAPLLARGKAIGAIVAFNKVGGGSFTRADLKQRLQPLADQAAVAIENARLYAAQQRRAQEGRTLLDIASVVSSTLNMPEVLKRVTQRTAQVCGAHRCTILMLTEDREMVIPTMSQFSDGHIDREMWQLFKDARYPVPVSQVPEVQQIIREQRPLFVPDALASSVPGHWIKPFSVKSILIVPLVSKERVIGLMGLDHVEEGLEFTAEQVDLAMAIAAQAATAVENARLFEEERDSRRLANILQEIAQALNSTLSLNDVLNLILAELERVIAFDSGSIMLLEGRDLVIYAVKGFTDPDSVLKARLDLDMAPLNREVVGSKQPLIVGSVHEDERWLKPRRASGLEPELRDIRSWMGVPLVVKDRVIGILTTDKVEAHFYSEKDAEVALAFANQAAVAIKNARLLEETREHVARLERKTGDLELVHQVSQVVSSSLDLTRILETTAEQMVAVFEADHSGILLFDQAQIYGRVVAEYPSTGATAERFPVQGYLAAERIIADREPLVIEDVWNDPLMAAVREAMHRLDIRSMLIMPLIVKGEVVGSIGLDSVGRQRCFNAEEVALAQTIANQVAIAIQNARLFEDAQRRAEEMTALHETTLDITVQLEMPRLLDAIIARASDLLGATGGLIHLYDPARERLVAVTSHNLEKDYTDLTLEVGEGIAGRVFQTGEPLIIDDHRAWAGKSSQLADADARSMLGVPLKWQERILGVLDIMDNVRVGAFDEHDLWLLTPFANQAAIAIQNARLFEETKQRAHQLEALTEVGRAIGSTLNLDEVLQLILERLEDVVPYDAVSLWLREGEVMRTRAVRGFEVSEAHLGLTVTLQDDVLSQEMVSTRRPFILADAQQDERFCSMASTEWVRSWLGVPLLSKGEVIGLITVNKKEPGLYTAETAALALAFGQQAAMAIENARLYEETKQRAEEMTALYHTSLEIPTNLPDLLWTICDRAARLLDVDKGGLYLYDEAREELELVVSYKLGRDSTGARIKLGEGVAGRVVQTGQPLIVDDYSRWDGRARVYEGEPFATVIGIPLKWQERVIGVIALAEERGQRMFTPDDERLLSLFAQQAAVAIENARLYEGTMRHVEELTALHNIDVTIASTLNLDEVLQRVYEQVSAVMDIAAFHIALYDEEKGELHLPIIVDQGRRLPPRTLKVEEESGLSGWVVRTRELLWIEDLDKERDALPVKAIALGVPTRSLMVLPLVVRDKVVGVMSAQSYEPYAFDEGHRRLFSGIASQVAIAIENARLFDEINRRLVETRLLQEVMQAAASTLDFDEVLTRTIETLRRTLGIEYLAFALPDERGTGLVLHPSRIGYPPAPAELRLPLDGSVTGRVYQSGEPQIITDVREVPYYLEGAPEIRSELAVPVKVAGRVIAVLNAESPHLGEFSEDDLRLFSAVAAQLGVVLENARLYEEVMQRLAEGRLTQEVMLASASTLDFDLVLERTVKALHRALGIACLGFLLPDEQGGALVSHPSLVGFAEGAFRIPIAGSLVGQAYRTGQPVLVRDVTQEPAYSEMAPGTRSVLAVPVRISGRVIAVLHAESPQVGAFGENELRLFTTIAGQLGVTLESARLYQRLEAQAAELSQAYGELQEINRLRTELVQNVGHELRTPLGLIQGYVELLLEGDLGRILDSQRAALQIIRERSATLARLIHNLTMLQAVPREALALAPVSVVEVVQHALAEFRRSAEKAGIAFQEELPAGLPPVLGDRERLELVFGHLVDNAIKFSPGGGTITLRAWAEENQVYVLVADEGIGIAPDHLDRVFERFYQVDGTTRRRFGGMGVGLALVWEIVEAHGGTVTVESGPGEGSTFTVALPQAEESSAD